MSSEHSVIVCVVVSNLLEGLWGGKMECIATQSFSSDGEC